jgi:hypothetical protein
MAKEDIKHELALGTVCYLSAQEAFLINRIARVSKGDWETLSALKDVLDATRRSREDFRRNCLKPQ